LQTQTGTKKSRGVEFQANHNVEDDLSLTAAFSYATAELSGENFQTAGIPKYTASLFGTKTVELTSDVRLRLGGGVRYQGKQTSRSGAFIVVSPSYTLVDALVAFDYNKWTLQLNAVNLFDERYYPGCSAFGSCANGEPRTVQGTLSYRF
ncbi:MAG: TonB-dependent receptor domain-containing protein, partial [Sphingopyxis sp.]